MYIDNGIVELISSIIMVMGKKYGIFHHELFLSTLNQLLRMSPVRVKEICSSLEDFKQSLTSLKDITYSDPDESRYQARYFVNGFLTKKQKAILEFLNCNIRKSILG